MRFKAGLVIGFAAGYYLGAQAGRERYEQINRWLQRAQSSDAFDAAADKAKAVVDLGVERARDLVGDEGGNGATGATGPGPSDIGSGPVREPYPRPQ